MAEDQIQQEISTSAAPSKRGLPIVAVLLLCATAFSLIDLLRERRQARQLAATNAGLNSILSQTRSEIGALTAKLNALSAPPAVGQGSPSAGTSAANSRRRALARTTKKSRAVEDPRWKQVRAELSEHEKRITAAQQDIERTRSETEGNLKSTRAELGGAIARNHEELVALEKRGERNYYEFDLTKSKQFGRAGPLSLSLRKADAKNQRYDLTMLVDDFQLTKKRVNLYEPVLLYPAESDQPLELVVNRIEKNQVHGYVSEPKYRQAEAAMSAPSAADFASPPSAQVTLPHRAEPGR